MEKINTEYMQRTFESYLRWNRLNLVEWFKGKNFSNKLTLNQLEMVHHNQGKKRNNFSLTLQANFLPLEDLNCEQSVFCLKIFREESKEKRNTREW